jgi:signal transduction histidine kinase
MSKQHDLLTREFSQDRLHQGYWPATVASACLSGFAFIAWATYFWARHDLSWTQSSQDILQTFRLIGAAVALAYVFVSIRFEATIRPHSVNWISILVVLSSSILTSLIVGSFEVSPQHAFDFAMGSRIGTAILIVTLIAYCALNLPIWRITLVFLAPAMCLVRYTYSTGEAGLVTNVSFVNYLFAVHLIGIVLYEFRRRQEFELFKQRKITAETLQNLAKSEAREKQLSAAKTRLIGSVSHDLRQPLNSLALYNNLLKSKFGGDQNATLNSIAERVQECVAAMEGNLSRLQDIARLQASATLVETAPVSLVHSLQSVQSVFQPIADAADVRLVVRIPVGSDIILNTHSERLFEILANLLSNAIKFSSGQSERNGWVLVTTKKHQAADGSGALQIIVRDNGLGIAPENQARIFDEYVQLNNPERQSLKGYGLGLSVVRELADSLSNHSVTLKSRLGSGARFTIAIPTVTADQAAKMRIESQSRTPNSSENDSPAGAISNINSKAAISKLGAPAPLQAASVLLVEDDEPLRAALSAQLTYLGAEVRAYPSARHALAATANDTEPPTCIISDYWLPAPFDGLQTIAKLRDQFEECVPALLISAASDIDPKYLEGTPNLEFALKPVSANTLLSYVKKHHRLE